jgi:hypothetical protein
MNVDVDAGRYYLKFNKIAAGRYDFVYSVK